jgi:eukaryotic-like serine/threonine-protein kinase
MSERSIFLEALEIDDPSERAAFLHGACAGDPALRRRVEELLGAHEHPDEFMRQPAPAIVTTLDSPAASEAPGAVVAGRYKLLESIGEGGMGEVWVADQLEPIRRRVAIKLIKAGMDSRAVLARFEAERQALAMMDHPNIARVLDAGTTADGRPYFVMELVKGVPITKFCDERKLSTRERLKLFVPVCQAIQHAHQKGLIHRDVKPSNVLVELYDDRAVPKVIDFGVAKAVGQKLTEKTLYTGFGALVGTPAYMAPEQATFNALDVDTRADVYSLGVLLYELLSGSPPFEPERLKKAALDEVLRVVREEEPPRPSHRLSTSRAKATIAAVRQSDPEKLTRLVRGELDWIVMKALEKDRARRYETANGLAKDVERYLNDEAVEACPPTLGYRLRKAFRKHRTAAATAAAFAAVLLAGAAVATRQAVRATRAEADARAAEREATADRDRARDAEVKAMRERANTQASLDFLGREILARASPWQVTDRDRELRTLLDRAAAGLESATEQPPLVRASIRHMVGELYIDLGELHKARRHLEQALDVQRRELGEDDPRTLAAMYQLARCLFWGTRYGEAAVVFDRVLERRRRVLGAEDPDTLATLLYAGGCHAAQGRHAAGEALLARASEALARAHPGRHREINGASLFLGLSLAARGELDRAEAQLTATLELARRVLGEDPRTASVMRALARAYVLRGEAARAIPLAEEAVGLYRALMGDQHPFTLTAIRVLAGAYHAGGRYSEAAPLLAEAQAGYRRIAEGDGPREATVLGLLGENLLARGKYPEAESTLRECLGVWDRQAPPGGELHLALSPRGAAREYAFTQCLLGASLLGQKRYPEAERWLLQGYEGLTRQAAAEDAGATPFDRARQLEALAWLVRLYEDGGKPDEAARWRAEMAKYPPRAPAPRPVMN